MRLAILADDFTGALDTSVQFSSQGISTVLTSGEQPWTSRPDNCEVLTMDLQTRHLPPADVYRRVYRAAEKLRQKNVPYLYIKTDSGMRGNVGAALAAAADSWKSSVYFVPAYPKTGRTVVDGALYVDGKPVSESVFGEDLFNPVRRDRIADIIGEQTRMPVVEKWQPEGAIVLRNASTNEDMKRLAAEITPDVRLMAGCAGLAHYLPDKLQIPAGKLPEVTLHQPLLVISGSTSKVSFDQLRYCEEKGFRSILLTDILEAEPDFKTLVRQVMESPHSSGVLLEVIRSEEEYSYLNPKASCLGLDSVQISERIASNLGKAAAAVVEAGFQGTLFVFGGDTLACVLREIRAQRVEPLCETESGVVISEVSRDNGSTLFVISKSGSFGSVNVVENVCTKYSIGAFEK